MTTTVLLLRECAQYPATVVPAVDGAGMEEVFDPDLTPAMRKLLTEILSDPDTDNAAKMCATDCQSRLGSYWHVGEDRDGREQEGVLWAWTLLVEKQNGEVVALCEDCGGVLL